MWKNKRLIFGVFFLLLFIGAGRTLFAQDQGSGADLTMKMAVFVFQLGVILFAARAGAYLFERINLPALLGELTAGIIIGPYVLGHLALPGFPQGIFPPMGGDLPVSSLLYAFMSVASIVLLFMTGLETDLETFLSFSLTGFVVGLGGLLVSFFLGAGAVVLLSPYFFGAQYGFHHPMALFLGVTSVATSVSISARILSDKRKMDSPVGVTILSAAVIDDVLGIIVLAVVIGIIKSGHVQWEHVALISLKALLIWLGFTVAGLVFSRRISEFLKKARDNSTITVMSLACALLLAGIFEKSGLAMIVGAYIMGLSLSKTDLSFIIQENLSVLYKFFIPIFFCVMGMYVNFRAIGEGTLLSFAVIYIITAILGKVIGCSIPSLFLDFNLHGALSIGVGMIPRGEVGLIVAGMGLSSGLLSPDAFSIVILMVFVTTLITPPVLNRLVSSKKPVLRKTKPIKREHQLIVYPTPNPETAELLLSKVIQAFEEEEFFIHRINLAQTLYQIRKGETFITLNYTPKRLVFDCLEKDVSFVHTVFYEVIAELERMIGHLETFTDKKKVGEKIFSQANGSAKIRPMLSYLLSPLAVEMSLQSGTKQGIIEELIGLLVRSGQVLDSQRQNILMDVLEREASVSTGMQDGVALPHAKTESVDTLIWALGVKKEGVDFESLDNKPSQIFVLLLSPRTASKPHLQFMAEISRFLIDKTVRNDILTAETNDALYAIVSSFFRK